MSVLVATILVAITTAVVAYLLILPRIVLAQVNRVRIAADQWELKRLLPGHRGDQCECPIARSFGYPVKVERLHIELLGDPGIKVVRKLQQAWGKPLGPKNQFAVHFSTAVFSLLFDCGLYPSYKG